MDKMDKKLENFNRELEFTEKNVDILKLKKYV